MATIRSRTIAFCALAILATLAIGLGAIFVSNRLSDDLGRSTAVSTALRNHTIGDMIHDGLRAVVLNALLANEIGADKDTVDAELAEMVDTITGVMAANKAFDLPPDAAEAIRGVDAPLAAYVASAQHLAALAFSDRPAAIAALPGFERDFQTMEGAMDRAGDRIEAASQEIHVAATSFSGMATIITIAFLLVGVAVMLALSAYVFFGVLKPLAGITSAMGRLAEGEKGVVVPGLARADEIGTMARALQVFKENSEEADRLREAQKEADARALQALKENAEREERQRAEQKEQEARVIAARKAELEQLAERFDGTVSAVVGSVTAAVTQLKQSAAAMSGAAGETTEKSAAVAVAAEEATSNVQTVASAAEELAASVGEIGQQVSTAARIAVEAMDQSGNTVSVIKDLASGAQRIGQVINLITDIASQTNLLALNATIEAARAGEAGRGFAVVANEVKALAEQTSKATGDISSQIVAIQNITNEVVRAIEMISSTIKRIDQTSSTIAAAVEEQGAATSEIAQSVQQAALGTQEVSANIIGVRGAADATGRASAEIVKAAANLEAQSSDLRTQVDAFIAFVRAA